MKIFRGAVFPLAIAILGAAKADTFAMGGIAYGGYSDMQSFHISLGNDRVGITVARLIDYSKVEHEVIQDSLPTNQFTQVRSDVVLNPSIMIGFDYYQRVKQNLSITFGLGLVVTESCDLHQSDNTGRYYCSSPEKTSRLESSVGIRQAIGEAFIGAGYSASRGAYLSIGASL